ncbi:MAG: alpha/beta hydrolase [Phyllobacteriaceae bacterium]|nr:alpha/beta hydrolase [Phyllobacteriaceae bacterium]
MWGALLVLAALLAGVTACSSLGASRIAKKHPAGQSFFTANATRLHAAHVAAPAGADLPPLVFIHGASGNLLDQMIPLRPHFEGRAEMLFFDRPGHGWSDRGPASNASIDGQADTLAALMAEVGISRAIVVGHSFGGAVAAAFAVRHPDKTAGLVFLAAATHPWPGAATNWYYNLTVTPLIGPLFSQTLALPAGLSRMEQATACVFSPNRKPDAYVADAAIELVLRPANFRANAADVEGLYRHVLKAQPLYAGIKAPTVVITGDRDSVVLEEIHSFGLARDIAGAELVQVRNLGHKPEWVAPELALAAVEKVAGKPRDLQALARSVEARIADDAYGPPERCKEDKPDPK